MNLLRRHPSASGIVLAILIASTGSFLGQSFAIQHTNEIAEQLRAKRPDDLLDGLWIIGLGITLVSSAIAAVIGLAAGLMLYIELKRSAAYHSRYLRRSST